MPPINIAFLIPFSGWFSYKTGTFQSWQHNAATAQGGTHSAFRFSLLRCYA